MKSEIQIKKSELNDWIKSNPNEIINSQVNIGRYVIIRYTPKL